MDDHPQVAVLTNLPEIALWIGSLTGLGNATDDDEELLFGVAKGDLRKSLRLWLRAHAEIWIEAEKCRDARDGKERSPSDILGSPELRSLFERIGEDANADPVEVVGRKPFVTTTIHPNTSHRLVAEQ